MMKLKAAASTVLITGMLVFAVSGCEKGPAEKAGENIDESVEKMGESLEETGDNIQDAGQDAAE